MEIPKTYNPSEIEDKWYQYWKENNFFTSIPDSREPYTIVIPPPNVTGVLHMGHILNNTIQDVLIRKARMQGKNACWVPGTDHASIATEAKVVAMLREKGIKKSDISREEFLQYAWEWKKKYGGIILKQLEKIGASCDWNRTRFTMDEDLYDAVMDVFIDLVNKGYIYRGKRMVNWDPKGKTALSNEEVIYKETPAKLYHIKYLLEGSDNKYIVIATQRPETIMADVAVCFNPNDKRFTEYKNKRVIIPLINKSVPVIYDTYVDIEFGSGALKITPAHDINDYEIGKRHRLPVIDILNDDATLNEEAQIYVGEDCFEARKKIVTELKEKGFLVKEEEYISNIGYSERTHAVVEPKLSLQWFCDMQKLAKPALDNVLNETIAFFPHKFINTYKHWMENVRDWCISRQLWWGHRIPVWYTKTGEWRAAKTVEAAIAKFKSSGINVPANELTQDEDVLDTWFSAWLWPITVFDGFKNPENKDINYYYPTNILVTAPDILFFWVARMVMSGYEYRGTYPFKNVYLTGTVRDKQGRKMSKSLGNSPEPLDLIAKYGADSIRTGMLFCSPAGNDLLFDESLCEQGRNFTNKIWNAFRLIKNWQVSDKINMPMANEAAIKWFKNKLSEVISNNDRLFEEYRLSEALMETYKLVWDDFCSWYLEIIKPEYGMPIDMPTYQATIELLEAQIKLLHPFMPFITEEIWNLIAERNKEEKIIVADWPLTNNIDKNVLHNFEYLKNLISTIRNFKKEKSIKLLEQIDLLVSNNNEIKHTETDKAILQKLGGLKTINEVMLKPENVFPIIYDANEYFIPLSASINIEEEVQKLKADLDYQTGFKNSVLKKLNNEKFVKGAPESVVAREKKKLEDANARIKVLEESLSGLKIMS